MTEVAALEPMRESILTMVLLGHHGGLIVLMVQDLLTTALVGGMIELVMPGRPGKRF